MKKTNCRMCKSSNIQKFLDLGFSALADNFLTLKQLEESETFFPLTVNTCQNCGLCQLGYVVPPELMFNQDYPYDSSTTKTGRDHFTKMGIEICEKFELEQNSLIIDVGSNAGVLLDAFKSKKMRVLGIEPSSKLANIAIKKGIDSIIDFFSGKLIKKILNEYGKVSVITGTNVFAHIDDLDDFMKTADSLLVEDGLIVIEAPYLVNLLENLEYDTIYHEHLSYLSVKPMIKFCQKFDFEIFDIEEQSIHGGTLRYFIGRKNKRKITNNVSNYLELETKKEIYSRKRLENFANSVKHHRKILMELLHDLKKDGKKIVAISAPAKGNTLLNYCKIDSEILSYVTERNPLKIGTFTPGMHIPVYSDEKLLEDQPDYALILAWNFSDEIIKNNSNFQENGGKFIIPTPEPKIV
ncbi:class I SAM-dependent methyltransferase [Candidatus Nitrosopumilus sp. SW]|uniref:class I SAM-dependent methyltransferase n=1 Tax=Candidatus Nitrosopumilus sp. SW TaxID=2508726 RepID=UPI0011521E03|nr:class I SAM-dependent methyltransferase [Candidatus Nitrosopumilus sp. SW]QDI88784.1 class I SAM-dependent methyltransferase [Candidatus Nitrosopumilus sp. SW]